MTFIISMLLKLATSKAAEKLIGIGINKLLESKDSGISKDLATTIISGVVASKSNPTTKDVFSEALAALGK